MVNEEKVILMTKLAAYEQGEGRKCTSIAGYFRTDYVSSYLLGAIIAGTLAFVTVLGVYIFYDFEVLMENIYNTDFLALGRKVGTVFLVFMGIYLIFSYALALYRFSKAKSSLRTYYNNLKKLEKFN
jgi:hypothetical protein